MKIRIKNTILKEIEDSIEVKSKILKDKIIIQQIFSLSELCINALSNSKKIIFAGNGGSFADAQHLSAEFTSRFRFNRSPLASIVLGINSSSMSAIGNDYGFDNIFKRELLGLYNPGDVFIPITTSGNSKNIINCTRQAVKLDLNIVAFTSTKDNYIKKYCETIKVPSNDTARIQECHVLIGHILCGLVEDGMFNKR
tara:strand:- start:228 stop:818 length:591 start_codon:yes stop_codon:yes gene_type:complete